MLVRSKIQQHRPHAEISGQLHTPSAEEEPRPPAIEPPTECSQAEYTCRSAQSGETASLFPATEDIRKESQPDHDSCSAVSVPCCPAAQPCPPPVTGTNQVVLVLQPDESTQYMLFSEDRALRDAAAKQAALEAQEKGLVPCDPRDTAIMQAIEEGDAAVRRVFQRRLHAALSRRSQSSQDAQQAHQSDSEMSPERSDQASVDNEAAWLARSEAADMALTAELNQRDAALSAQI